MAYFFKCKVCDHKETFADIVFPFPPFEIPLVALEGSLQDYESVICNSCITYKTRLKGNYIIINRRTN